MTAQAAQQQEAFEIEDFGALFEESLQEQDIAEGSVVTGIISAIEKDLVIIDVGLKSDGRIPVKEFTVGGVSPELKAGDEVQVFLEKIENKHGDAVLSREKALREEAWEKLEKVCEKGEPVDGVIFGRVKGGFTVDVQGAVAFLPGSQVDVRPIRDVESLMNITQPFQILKMDRKRGNIVVSRRAIMEESRAGERDKLLENMAEGNKIDGIVKNITDYGAFIDLGGIDGLLHVTDISWTRINHPTEVFAVGDTIKVIVTKFDEKTKRISLGMKQLEANPWDNIEDVYKKDTKFKGKVSNITDYGAFVELETGIEGLVYISEMSWIKKNQHPSKLVAIGQEVEVMVLDVDTKKHRISLGMKQCETNPWEVFAQNNKDGDVIKGVINNITEFGLFVRLDGSIDGLVHHSDIKWGENGESVIAEFSKDDKVEAKILLIDTAKERVSLGIKQLSENPDGSATQTSSPAAKPSAAGSGKKGKTVTCLITDVDRNGLEVTFEEDGKGYIKKIELSRERKEQRPDRFAVGDRVDAKILSTIKGKTSLSIKALEVEQHKKAVSEYGSSDSGASLGDILGAALSDAEKKDK